MKIVMKYETKKVAMDIDVNELTGWLGVDVIEGESEEELQKRIQEQIKEEYNNPDYNNWHQHNRHIGYSKAIYADDEERESYFEPLLGEVKDSRIFFKEELFHEKIKNYNDVCSFIRNFYSHKPDLAEIMIKVWIDGFSIREIAEDRVIKGNAMSDVEYKHLVEKEENNLSKKLNRGKKKFQKVLQKTSDFDVPRGYLLEATKSSKKL